jgi:site-specific DNA-methyltransferase (adenine-specific)
MPVGDIWTDIHPIQPSSDEKLGYPTQKPLTLLERIIQASSNKGDVVLDPFSGCSTAISAAQKLERRWIGIDITYLAIAMHKSRLKDMYNIEPGKDYDVIGEPTDLSDARELAQEDRYQFQWWALSLVKARPMGSSETEPRKGKKGADQGIDGIIPFMEDVSGKLKRVLVQVKSGHVKSGDIRDLHGVLEREGAPIGLFITLDQPTADMQKEAVSTGYYYSEAWQQNYPRIQILTVEELLNGAQVKMPPTHGTFKKAERVKKEDAKQAGLGF